MPLHLVQAAIDELGSLESREVLLARDAVMLGTGSIGKDDARRLSDFHVRQAAGPDRAPAGPADGGLSAAELAWIGWEPPAGG